MTLTFVHFSPLPPWPKLHVLSAMQGQHWRPFLGLVYILLHILQRLHVSQKILFKPVQCADLGLELVVSIMVFPSPKNINAPWRRLMISSLYTRYGPVFFNLYLICWRCRARLFYSRGQSKEDCRIILQAASRKRTYCRYIRAAAKKCTAGQTSIRTYIQHLSRACHSGCSNVGDSPPQYGISGSMCVRYEQTNLVSCDSILEERVSSITQLTYYHLVSRICLPFSLSSLVQAFLEPLFVLSFRFA